jgi:serine/threonine protein kinase
LDDEAHEGGPVFMVLDGLGQGGYATVVKVQHLISKECFAMKVISKTCSLSKRERHKESLFNELKFMTEIPASPFVQRCHFAFESPTNVFFVVDLITGGDLFHHLTRRSQSNSTFSEDEVRTILAELFLALSHLHSHHIVHRDIKVENIMLDKSGHVKLVDLGLAVELEDEVQPMAAMGSLIYMAPELIRDRIGGRFTDWWAYGVLAHELLTGNSPWSTLDDTKTIKLEIQSGIVTPPVGVSSAAGKLVMALMCHDREERLGTKADEEIKRAPFFKTVDWVKTATLQSPPAFIPPTTNVNKSDQKIAIQAYFNQTDDYKQSQKNAWSLGLDDSASYLF